MRTRLQVAADIETTLADARSAAAEHDDISYDLDHHKLNDLLLEYEKIPQQAKSRD